MGTNALKASPDRGHSEVFDKSAAMSRLYNDKELFMEIVKIFLEDYPPLLARIEAAVEAGDAQALETAAHTLKGSVSNFCAKEAFEWARTLQEIGGSGDLTEAPEAVLRLSDATEELKNALIDFAEEGTIESTYR